MSFKIHVSDIGDTPPLVLLAATNNEVYVPGEALVITAGLATKCGATATPTHICHASKTGATGGTVTAFRILPTMVFETTQQAALTANALMSVVTLHTDGLQVTATATEGVATLDRIGGRDAGDKVWVRFL